MLRQYRKNGMVSGSQIMKVEMESLYIWDKTGKIQSRIKYQSTKESELARISTIFCILASTSEQKRANTGCMEKIMSPDLQVSFSFQTFKFVNA